MRLFNSLGVLLLVGCTLLARAAEPPDAMPSLEHFNPDQVDKTLDPCSDFFQYACGKWIKANPIPPDQAGSGTGNKLFIWNVAAVRSTLEDAANASTRTPVEQRGWRLLRFLHGRSHYQQTRDRAAEARTRPHRSATQQVPAAGSYRFHPSSN